MCESESDPGLTRLATVITRVLVKGSWRTRGQKRGELKREVDVGVGHEPKQPPEAGQGECYGLGISLDVECLPSAHERSGLQNLASMVLRGELHPVLVFGGGAFGM